MGTLRRGAFLFLGVLFASGFLAAEDTAAPPFRPPEGSVIIDLPSADVNPAGTLQLVFTHRFSQPVAGSNIHSLFSFDSGADIGIGLSYAPVKDLEIGFLRDRNLEDYELSGKYRIFSSADKAFAVSARAGGNWRTSSAPNVCRTDPRPAACSYLDDRTGFFAQAIVGVTFLSRLRITFVPTYVSRSAQQPFVVVNSIHRNVFNVPMAISIAVTRSINVQGEVVPISHRAASGGVGWIAAVEKTVLRHRFAFTVGNLRPTAVDQYVGADFLGRPRDYFLGFNIVRLWKLK